MTQKTEISNNIKEIDKDLEWNKELLVLAERSNDEILLNRLIQRRFELYRARSDAYYMFKHLTLSKS